MKLPAFLRGLPQVFFQEFLGNVKSIRFLVMAAVSALVVVGGAYGISGVFGGGGFGQPPFIVWTHPAFDANGDHVAVAWVADPFGAPVSGRTAIFEDLNRTRLGENTTNADGFTRLNVGTEVYVSVTVRSGTFEIGRSVDWGFLPPVNFTYQTDQADYDGDNAYDDLAVHVLDLYGYPIAGRVLVNETEVARLEERTGYALIELPAGSSNVTIEAGGQSVEFNAFVFEDGGPSFLAGPDFVLLVIATFSGLIVSIFAIVISFDAVSKERVQGTMDLLLSRPASRTGVLLGKFLAAFGAVALPVTVVNLAGIGMISAASGKAPTGSFATAFVLYSLLLIAYYVLLQLSLSTLAKTSGTAVLFGVLVWLLLNILYNVVTFVVANLFSGGDPATYFRITQYAALGNPSAVVGSLISLAAPEGLSIVSGGTALDAATFGGAAAFWFAFLFLLALWVFQKKAAV